MLWFNIECLCLSIHPWWIELGRLTIRSKKKKCVLRRWCLKGKIRIPACITEFSESITLSVNREIGYIEGVGWDCK